MRCKHHLWLVLGEDRPGSRGRHGMRWAPGTTVEPHTVTTCALDVAERERTALEAGELLGITQRRVQQIVKAALAKLRASGVELEHLRTLMEG